MRNRVTKEEAAIIAGAYLLILRAHVELPGLAPFAATLLALTALSTALLARVSRRTDAATVESAAGGEVSATVPAADEAAGPETMQMTLRGLEAELHTLEDQHLTALARDEGALR